MRRIRRRWSSPLGRLALRYGPDRFAQRLGTTRSTVYSYVSGRARIPYLRALTIVRLGQGSIRIEDLTRGPRGRG